MKKKLFLLVSVFLLFFLVGCDVSYKVVTEKGLSFEIPDNWKADKDATTTMYSDFGTYSFNGAIKIRAEKGDKSDALIATNLMNSGIEDFYDVATDGYKLIDSQIDKEEIEIDGISAIKITFEIHPPETLIIGTPSGDFYETNESNTTKYSYCQVFFVKDETYYNISVYTDITNVESLKITDHFFYSLKFT